MKNINSYIVRDPDGDYISGYSFALGEKDALSFAKDCARSSKSNVFLKTDSGEQMIFQYVGAK